MNVMHWQYTPYIIPLIVTAAVPIALACYVWRRHHTPESKTFVLLMLAVTQWLLTYALRLASANLEAMLFWAKVRYLGILVVPAAWLIFAVQQTGRSKWLTRRVIALLAIEPLLLLALVWTNEWHGLYWSRVWVDHDGGFAALGSTHGAAFWVHAAYSYLLMVAGALLFIQALIRSPDLYRGQAFAVLIGALAPLAGNMISVFGLNPIPQLDPTPFAFTLTGLAMAWGLFRFRLLDVVPVARDAIIESMSDGMLVLDAQNRVVDLNPAMQRIIQCAASKAVGQDVAQVLSAQPELLRCCREASEAHAEIAVGGDAAQRCFDLRISPLQGRNGRLTGRLIVLRDITERKRAEEELRRAKEAAEEANHAKTEFVSVVSHELRVPVSSIMGSVELLMAGAAGPVDETQAEFYGIIRANAERMLALISDLNDITQIESGYMLLEFAPVSIADVVEEVVRSFRSQIEGKGQALILEIPPDLPLVWGDHVRLVQVLTNLVGNAHKFTPPAGRIAIRAERSVAQGAAQDEREAVLVMVSDTGIGIKPDDQPKIFRKFFRATDEEARRFSGTGLGLSIAKNLVEMQGGRIWLESEFRKGTTVYFILPTAEAAHTALSYAPEV